MAEEFWVFHLIFLRTKGNQQLVCDTNQNQIPSSNVPNSLDVKGVKTTNGSRNIKTAPRKSLELTTKVVLVLIDKLLNSRKTTQLCLDLSVNYNGSRYPNTAWNFDYEQNKQNFVWSTTYSGQELKFKWDLRSFCYTLCGNIERK